mmetsp:Transcript_15449/g.39847  ORF Transcript_15449/g.39847 Transcript_15449/m.39847 type:complete len:308 (+) Transcript_15449:95-1018(+)
MGGDPALMALHTKSMFGDQVYSRRRSAPRFGFGSSTRQQQGKVFMSTEHAKLAPPNVATPGAGTYAVRAAVGPQCDGSKASAPMWAFGKGERFGGNEKPAAQNPGPGAYDVASGVGQQVSSAKQSQPMFGFGSATRDHVKNVYISEEHNKSLHGVNSPGPMYTVDASVGVQHLSQKGNQPRWVFSAAQRFQYEHVKRAATSPGPGSYTLGASVGPQFDSSKHSSPMPGFGTSNRDQMEKIFISTEHEKSQCGNNSPGPCSYAVPNGNGPQHLSVWQSAPNWGFGTSARWQKQGRSSMSVPGPGAYSV